MYDTELIILIALMIQFKRENRLIMAPNFLCHLDYLACDI